jgi:hypothetical protein
MGVFKIVFNGFLICFFSASEKKNGNWHIFAYNLWAILPFLLLADGGYLGISEPLSSTL